MSRFLYIPSYVSRPGPSGPRPVGRKKVSMEKVTIRQAAEELHLTMETVRILMQQGVLDIGYVKVNEKGRCTYIIFRHLLDQELARIRG